MKVLITAPGLSETENVSGISTLVREMIASGRHTYTHFTAGRRDRDPGGVAWMAKQATLIPAFTAAVRKCRPEIVHINTAFITLAVMRDAALVAAAMLLRIPIVLHVHGGPFVMAKPANQAIEELIKWMMRTAALAIVFSDRERDALLRRVPDASIAIVPNGVKVPAWPPDARVGRPVRTVIFLGRLHASKGLDHIVAVTRDLKKDGVDFRYACYGTGPEEKRFIDEMRKILGEQFEYGGVVSGSSAKHRAFADADIFFQPSRDEGMPLALLEAMAAGCIPVMSESGAVADVIAHGRNGFLVPGNDRVAMKEQLRYLLETDEAALAPIRQRAWESIIADHSFDTFLDSIDGVYQEAESR